MQASDLLRRNVSARLTMAEVAEAEQLSPASTLDVGSDIDTYLLRLESRMRQFKALAVQQQTVIEGLRRENAALKLERDGLVAARCASSAEIARLCLEAAESAERVAELEAAGPQGGGMVAGEEGDGKHVFVDAREPGSQGLLIETCEDSQLCAADVSDTERGWEGRAHWDDRELTDGSSVTYTAWQAVSPYNGDVLVEGPQRRLMHAMKTSAGLHPGCNPPPHSMPVITDGENLTAGNSRDAGIRNAKPSPSLGCEIGDRAEKSDVDFRHVMNATRGNGTPAGAVHAVYASSRSAAKYAYSVLRAKALR